VTPSSLPRLALIVVAAGSGTRLNGGGPKAFVALDDRSILEHALDGVFAAPSAHVVVVVPDGYEDAARAAAEDRGEKVDVVVGGRTRQESVAAGLAVLEKSIEFVLVHDAARALTPVAVFERVAQALEQGASAVIPAVPVVDTIKRVDGDGVILAAVDRSELAAAQTPQGFRRDVLEEAVAAADADHTDDAALVAAAGHTVVTVAGDANSFKITTAPDLDRARGLVAPRPAMIPRIGIGTDVHGFGGEGALWLAGLEWPGETALSGHSDGDAVAHAIVDAVLAAAGLGDIGTHFGTDRPEFAGPGAGESSALRRSPDRGRAGSVGRSRRGAGVGQRHDDGRPGLHRAHRGRRRVRDRPGRPSLERPRHEGRQRIGRVRAERRAFAEALAGVESARRREVVAAAGLEPEIPDAARPGLGHEVAHERPTDSSPEEAGVHAHRLDLGAVVAERGQRPDSGEFAVHPRGPQLYAIASEPIDVKRVHALGWGVFEHSTEVGRDQCAGSGTGEVVGADLEGHGSTVAPPCFRLRSRSGAAGRLGR